MEFISEDRIRVKIRSEIPAVYDTKGNMVSPMKRRVFAQFERGAAPLWARQQAAEIYTYERMPVGTTPERFLSYYNSDEDPYGWNDEEREAIDQKLLVTHSVVLVERPKSLAPWPTYDKLTVTGRRTIELVVEKICSTVADLGLNADHVAAYERENLNRPEVIAGLAKLQEGETPEPLVAA